MKVSLESQKTIYSMKKCQHVFAVWNASTFSPGYFIPLATFNADFNGFTRERNFVFIMSVLENFS